jgi:stage V sporulation protein S
MSLQLELESIHELRVKATSPVKKLAAAISTNVLDNKRVILSAIGAGANNQAIKAVIIARQYLIASNIELSILPALPAF